MANVLQSSFLGGEWSPLAQGRLDLPAYQKALSVCRNSYPLEEGAWIRRSGTRFAATTLNGRHGRLLKFAFEQTSPYFTEFTAQWLRMYASLTQTLGFTNGAQTNFGLVTTNDNRGVTSISAANPAVVTTDIANGWLTGVQVEFLFDTSVAPTLLPLLRNRVFTITFVSPVSFSIADPITGATIDGATLGWPGAGVPAGQMVVARILQITTPYVNEDWRRLRTVQAETEQYLLHNRYATQSLRVATAPSGAFFASFNFGPATFIDGPYLDPPTDGSTITPGAASGNTTLTASAITGINGGLGFQSTDVGRLVRLLSEPAAWASGTGYVVGDNVKYNGAYFTCIQAGTGYVPDAAVAYWGINTAASTWSWAQINSITSTTVVAVTIKGATLVNTNAMPTWRMGLYSNTTGWPSCGVYYEGRIWLAGAFPNRIDSSKVNLIKNGSLNMTPTGTDGTIADDNAISYIFNSDDVNPIYWMVGAAGGIVCGTLAGEWLVNAPTAGPITPTNIQAHHGTHYGCADIDPEATELTISFVQRYSRKILEYFPDALSGRYTAPNLMEKAKHLTIPGIEEIRYQQELLPILWARIADGSFIGCTYRRNSLFSSQGPEFIAWHRHDLGSARTVESIMTGPTPDGQLDTLAMVTEGADGIHHVEIAESIFDIGTPIEKGWFVDDAVVPSGGNVVTTAGVSTLTLYGLWHLNGSTVTVTVGGVDVGDFAVSNGAVAVEIDADSAGLFTSAYLASISSQTEYGAMTCKITNGVATYWVPAVVGFTYTSQGQTLRADTVEQTHSPTGPTLGKPSRSHQVGVLFEGAQGVSFGGDLNHLRAAQFKSPGGTVALTRLQLFSGVYWDTIEATWDFDGWVAWQISRPYPCAIAAINAFSNNGKG